MARPTKMLKISDFDDVLIADVPVKPFVISKEKTIATDKNVLITDEQNAAMLAHTAKTDITDNALIIWMKEQADLTEESWLNTCVAAVCRVARMGSWDYTIF